jgi:ornithine cyclodeaminase/alanine dehydrogenase
MTDDVTGGAVTGGDPPGSDPPVLVLSDADVRGAFTWHHAVVALRQAYGGAPEEARFPGRTMARGSHGWLRTLSGVPVDPGLMGLKIIAAAPATGQVSYLVPLFDQRTTRLVALLDGHSITGFRTAATSALAADVLALPGPLRVGVIGSGFEAQTHLRALAAGRDLHSVRVYSPSGESRSRFVAALSDLAVPATAAESAESAVTEASLVICAARSRDESPTLSGGWLRPGMTVVSIGSTLPEQRELDVETLARADLVVADALSEVLDDTGDCLAARAAGVDIAAKAVPLADVVGGRHPGRTGEGQIIVYKSVGSAVQDLAVAGMCVRRAAELGLGRYLPIPVSPVKK